MSMSKSGERKLTWQTADPDQPYGDPVAVCPRCTARGKTWEGSDPKCAFVSGEFSSDNWNCATMNDLRDIAEEGAKWNEDDYAGIVPADPDTGGFIVLGWYKRRGKTEGALHLLNGNTLPLTLNVAELALAARRASQDR